MQVLQMKSSVRHLRPLLGLLPWLIFATLGTAAFATLMIVLPWLGSDGADAFPLAVQICAVVLGAGMWGWLVPAQITVLLRETTATYTIKTDATFLSVAYSYCGITREKRFAWRDIQSIGLPSVGLPPCEFIRIDPLKGAWFSFGIFISKSARHEILNAITRHWRSATVATPPSP